MSLYSGGRTPLRTSREERRVINSDRPPTERRIGGNRRARVTVETGGGDEQYRQSPPQRTARMQPRASQPPLRPILRDYPHASRYPEADISLKRQQFLPSRFGSTASLPQTAGVYADEPIAYVEDEPVPHGHRDDWSPAESDDSDDVDFRLPKSEKHVQFSKESDFIIPGAGDDQAPTTNERFNPSSTTTFNGQYTELLISQSRWCGNTVDRGDLSGEVTVSSISPEHVKKQPPPMMKWCHLERSMLSFEEFMAAAISSVTVSDKEQRDIALLLRDVQKKFEKQRHHGREMEPDCVSDVFYNNSPGEAQQTASVMFLSFPYFCLEPYCYGPIRALGPGSPFHPPRPILQSHFFSSTQARELSQVIATMPGTPSSHCLHISQLWCLIVDGATMITCSKSHLENLCDGAIERTRKPSRDKCPLVKVSVGTDRSWLVPVSESTSWPAFLSMFGEKATAFEYDGDLVDGSNWQDIMRGAADSPPELSMKDFETLMHSSNLQINEEATRGSDVNLRDANHHIDRDFRDSSLDATEDEPPHPTLLTPAHSMPVPASNSLQLFKQAGSTTDIRKLADSLHRVLNSNTRSAEKDLYQHGPSAKLADIEQQLRHDDEQSSTTLSKELRLRRKTKRRVVAIAKYLHTLFWPSDFEHAMLERFWGALHHMLSAEHESRSADNNAQPGGFVPFSKREPTPQGNTDSRGEFDPRAKGGASSTTAIYRVLHDSILPIATLLTSEFLTYEQDLKPLPDAFSTAWLHIFTAVLYASEPAAPKQVSFVPRKDSVGESPAIRHLNAAAKDLESARLEITARLQSIELDDFEICTESSLLALLLNKLAGDVMHGRPDVVTSYTDYFQSLEFEITENPSLRSLQQKVRDFLQEVKAILATLESQLSVLDVFERGLEQQNLDSDATLIYSLGPSRHSIVIQDCTARINGRIDKFKGLQLRAEELGEWHQNMVESNKDRQENAIMVFTIVTIIFLPLSFVASVFGMNTKDVRDMPYHQWVYWVTGLPLTVVVVVGRLWWAGELEEVGSWFGKTMSRQQRRKRRDGRRAERPTKKEITMRYETPVNRRDDAGLEEQFARPKRRTTYPQLH